MKINIDYNLVMYFINVFFENNINEWYKILLSFVKILIRLIDNYFKIMDMGLINICMYFIYEWS